MPFCPQCHAEYRPGFEACATCEGVALVAELPKLVKLTDGEETLPVQIASSGDSESRRVRVGDIEVDLDRAYPVTVAAELKQVLIESGHAALIKEIQGIEFPGGEVRYEVHVRKDDHAEAEKALREVWAQMSAAEGLGDGASGVDAGQCPACGAKVPMNVADCPDCGLCVGVGEPDEDEDEAGAEDSA